MNVNDTVLVKIKDSGIEELKRQHEEFAKDIKIGPFREPKVCPDGYTKMQLHDVMYLFGHLMYAGNPNPPIDLEIKTG